MKVRTTGRIATEEHGRLASPAEPTLGPVQVGFREQNVTTELLHEGVDRRSDRSTSPRTSRGTLRGRRGRSRPRCRAGRSRPGIRHSRASPRTGSAHTPLRRRSAGQERGNPRTREVLHDAIFPARGRPWAPSPSPRPALAWPAQWRRLRARTPDGVSLALHDLGGEGPTRPAHTRRRASTAACSARSHAVLGAVSTALRPTCGGTASPDCPRTSTSTWTGFGTDVLTAVDDLRARGRCRHRAFLRGRGSAAGRGGTPGHILGPLLFRARRLSVRRSRRRQTPPSRLPSGARQRREIFASRGRPTPITSRNRPSTPSTRRLSPPTSSSDSRTCPTARSGSYAEARTRRGYTRAGSDIRPSPNSQASTARSCSPVALRAKASARVTSRSSWSVSATAASKSSPDSGISGLSSSRPPSLTR